MSASAPSLIFAGILVSCLVQADIVFREEPSDTVVVEGQSLSLHCLVEDDEAGRGRIVVYWLHNNVALQMNSDPRLNLLPNGTLYVTSTQPGDEGTYSCLASVIGSQGVIEQKRSVKATLSFAYIEAVFYHPANATVTDQQPTPANFQCISGDSLPKAVVSWEKDGQLLTPQYASQGSTMFGSSVSRKTSGTLQIDNVRTRHAGRYRCITTNPLLPGLIKYSTYATLIVIPHPGQPYISRAPSSQIIPLGDPVRFICEILGDPAPVISWFKDGEPLGGSGDGRVVLLANGTLAFTTVTEADEGAYVCNGTNRLGSVLSAEVTLLTAYIDWVFLQEPEDLTVVEGQVATLICRPPNSKPATEITWYKDNQLLVPRAGTLILDVGDLYFSYVTEADEGEYFCVATNGYVPASRTSSPARLEVKVGATLTDPPSSTEVVLGDDLTLTCEAAGDPTPTLRWLMNNREISEGERITLGNLGGLLHIFGMTSLDRGTYTCVASNDYGTDRESVYVDVLVPPRLMTSPGDLSTGLGTSILIPCYAVGDPGPVVSWYKDGTPLTFDPPGDHYQKTNGGLYIAEVELSDNGVFICRAVNKVGSVEVNGTLVVETFPVFTVVPQNQTVSGEAVVFFECQAQGVPQPTLSWTFNGGPILPPLSLSEDGQRLTVTSASIQLSGFYNCTAENTQGSITQSAFLNVRTAPVLEPIANVTADAGEVITVTCNALFGFPDIDYSWLRGTDILTASSRVRFPDDDELEISIRGSDEGWYTCVATNDLGSSRESFYISVLDKPGVPTILEVLSLSESSIRVTWIPGGDTKDTESYQLQYRLSSDSAWNVHLVMSTGNRNESFVIHDLLENREYEIRIIATNSLGDSAPSTTVNAYTLSVSGPSLPRNLNVADFNSTSIRLEWEIPEERSGPIALYHISYNKHDDNASDTVQLPGEDRFTIDYTISGLRPNSLYYFQVCAATTYKGEIQQGNCTHYHQQRTSTAAPEVAPSDITLVPLTSNTISVLWSPIPEYYQNGEILGYNITYQSLRDGSIFVVSVDTSVTSYENRGVLPPWTNYTVFVEAYNADGSSPPSTAKTVRTKAAAPHGRPFIVANKTLNSTAIVLSWEFPEGYENRRGPIDGYVVTWHKAAEGSVMENLPVEETNITISGLSPNTAYEVTVAAYNVGDGLLAGPPSSPLAISTSDGVPLEIRDPAILQSGPSFIFLIWAPPLEDRGTITGYQIEYTALQEDVQHSGGNNRARRELSAGSNETHGIAYSRRTDYNLTGLAQDTNYSITIMAETSAGLGEGVTLYYTTDVSNISSSTTPGDTMTEPGHGSLEEASWRLLGLPLNSFIIFTSSVGLAFVFFLFAVLYITAWCSRASGKRQAKSRLIDRSLLRNDQFVQISPPSTDEGVDNCSRTDSSPTPSSLVAAPTSSQALDNRELVENRPRASSSPASAQLAVNPNTSRYSGGLPHYGTNPKQEMSRSAKSLDASPNQLEDLYSKVNRTSRGPGRFQKDSLAAIAALLDQEESDHEGRPPDSPPSVVIADQRTVL